MYIDTYASGGLSHPLSATRQRFSCTLAALSGNAAHNPMGRVRPREGMTLHLQNLHISQFQYPKLRGPKLRTNLDSPSPPAQL